METPLFVPNKHAYILRYLTKHAQPTIKSEKKICLKMKMGWGLPEAKKEKNYL